MTWTAATFADVTAYNTRAFAPRDYRRGRDYRRAVGSLALGVGTVTSVVAMGGFVTVAAGWMLASSFSSSATQARAPLAIETSALPKPYRGLAGVADLIGSTGALPVPVAAPQMPQQAVLTPRASTARAGAQAPAVVVAAVANVAPIAVHTITYHRAPARTAEVTGGIPIPSIRPVSYAPAKRGIARAAIEMAPRQLASAGPLPRLAMAEPPPPASSLQPRVIPPMEPADSIGVPGADGHSAIYDIVAHTVYLPDGEKLEAHSGLGRMIDDPHYANAKARGPTPPNVYNLTLRDGMFHGVRALRLNPVGDSRMYGRDGILAHTYMLGPSGQSFGCVSFKDYQEFLQAYLKGEINRIVVVPHLPAAPFGTARARHKNSFALNNG